MPTYPDSTAQAQKIAEEIAAGYPNFECVECGRDIVKALGPQTVAWVLKLRIRGESGIIIYPSRGIQVSQTGQHVGVRIGNKVFDNHHPEGKPVDVWKNLFTDVSGENLDCFRRPIKDFFGKIFRYREFLAFASSRFQLMEAEEDEEAEE